MDKHGPETTTPFGDTPTTVATLRTLLHLVAPEALEELDGVTLERFVRETVLGDDTEPGPALERAAEYAGLHLSGCTDPEVALRDGGVVLSVAWRENAAPVVVIRVLDALGRVRRLDARGAPTTKAPDDAETWLVTGIASLEVRGADGAATPLERLWHLVRIEGADIRVVLVYAAVIGLLGLVTPLATQGLVNALAFGNLLQPVLVLAVLVFFGLMFSAIIQAARAWVVERLQRRIFARLSLDLSWRLTNLDPDIRRRGRVASLLYRFYDVVIVQKAAGMLLADGIGLLMSVFVGLVLVFFYHPIFLAYGVLLIILLALTVLVPFRHGMDTSVRESTYKHGLAAWLHQVALHPETFNGHGAPFARRRIEQLTGDYLVHRRRHWKVLFGQMSLLLAIHVVAGAALLAVGGWLVVRESITLGQLVASELVVMTVLASTAKLDKHLEKVYDMLAALGKIGSMTDLRVAPADNQRVEGMVAMELRDLHALAAPGKPILAGVNVTVPPHGILAVHGATGSGRTTLAEIVSRLQLPSSGSVVFTDESGRRVWPDTRLLRPGAMFPGTVRDNLVCWNPEVRDETLIAVLESLELDHLTERLDQPLGNHRGAVYLSRSEQALMLMARAIVSEPDVLVIDDVIDELPPSLRTRALDALYEVTSAPLIVMTTRLPEVAALGTHLLALPGGRS